jgi:S1-C subfamily serine protease
VVTVASGSGEVGLLDVTNLAARHVDSVVTIEVSAPSRGRTQVIGSGSGVVVDEGGTIITNAHVVEGGADVSVTFADGTTAAATGLVYDETADLAVLDVDIDGLSPIELGSTADLEVGQPVVAIGNPLGLQGGPSVSTGIISALDRSLEADRGQLGGVIQTDAAITEGSSGGALLDADGRLIGITTAVGVSSVGIEGIGFALPVEDVLAILAEAGR